MKKVFYISLLILSCAFTITSCTDEEVTPKLDNTDVSGTGGSTGKL